ncbi:MAG: NAD(P)-binding domain-containing protein, partial [Eubacteriales bacterium]|nr:NAD(P)-binding domain-containing protein [Eubacteriales bacterium]
MKLGFIGTGNMGGALAKAASKTDKGITILLANRTAKKAERLAAEISGERNNSILVCDAGKAAAEADFLFLGVKPQMMEEMLASIKDILAGRTDIVLVTMAAGLSISGICEMLGAEFPVIRIMPNTPAA